MKKTLSERAFGDEVESGRFWRAVNFMFLVILIVLSAASIHWRLTAIKPCSATELQRDSVVKESFTTENP